MTYDSNSSTYYWYDEGNTELFHSFTTPYWTGGHAVSNYVIADYTTLPEGNFGWYELQFSNPIGGHNGSANFCVHNGYSDSFNSQIYDASLKGFEFADGVERVIDHMYITNTCYVLNSLTVGDSFALRQQSRHSLRLSLMVMMRRITRQGVVNLSSARVQIR